MVIIARLTGGKKYMAWRFIRFILLNIIMGMRWFGYAARIKNKSHKSFIGKHHGMKPRLRLASILVKFTKIYNVLNWIRTSSNS